VTGTTDVTVYEPGGFRSGSDRGPADRGANFFAGGANNTLSSITQSIDLSPASTSIDAGTTKFALNAYLGGFSNQDDNATLTLQYLSATGAVLGTTSLGPVSAADRANATSLLARSAVGSVPGGAGQAIVQLTMIRQGGAYDDGYADNLALTLFPDTSSSGLQSGGLVLVAWNDANTGNGATAGSWVDRITVRNTTTGK